MAWGDSPAAQGLISWSMLNSLVCVIGIIRGVLRVFIYFWYRGYISYCCRARILVWEVIMIQIYCFRLSWESMGVLSKSCTIEFIQNSWNARLNHEIGHVSEDKYSEWAMQIANECMKLIDRTIYSFSAWPVRQKKKVLKLLKWIHLER